jgi:hypothetical protein
MDQYIWVLVPVVAILAGTVKTWIRVHATQRRLGTSTHELEKQIGDLTRSKQQLTERIQNLEAIVVSQTWGVLQERGLSPAEKELKLDAVTRREIAAPEPTDTNQRLAERLASRLR